MSVRLSLTDAPPLCVYIDKTYKQSHTIIILLVVIFFNICTHMKILFIVNLQIEYSLKIALQVACLSTKCSHRA